MLVQNPAPLGTRYLCCSVLITLLVIQLVCKHLVNTHLVSFKKNTLCTAFVIKSHTFINGCIHNSSNSILEDLFILFITKRADRKGRSLSLTFCLQTRHSFNIHTCITLFIFQFSHCFFKEQLYLYDPVQYKPT